MSEGKQVINSSIPEPKEVLDFQLERTVTLLFKQFLTMIEDLEDDHNISFNKLLEALPEHERLIIQADYLGENKQEYLRKKILDAGNDCKRQIRTHLNNFKISYNDK